MTTIRLAQSKDANNLAALAIQVWLHTYATAGIRSVLSEYVLTEFTEEKFQKIIGAPDQIVIVAEIDRHLVGYVVLKFDQTRQMCHIPVQSWLRYMYKSTSPRKILARNY